MRAAKDQLDKNVFVYKKLLPPVCFTNNMDGYRDFDSLTAFLFLMQHETHHYSEQMHDIV